MRIASCKAGLVAFALCSGFAAMPARAMSPDVIEVDVPFAFVVNHTTLPAGAYEIRPLESALGETWVIGAGGVRVDFLTEPEPPVHGQEQAEVVFDELGDRNVLLRFWSGDGAPHHEVVPAERSTVARASARHERHVPAKKAVRPGRRPSRDEGS